MITKGQSIAFPLPVDEKILRCDHLFILTGPPCVGKSFALENPDSEQVRPLEEVLGHALGSDAPSSPCVRIDAWQLPAIADVKFSNVVLHYEIMRWRQGLHFRFVKELVQNAQRTTVLTLWASPSVLRKRTVNRMNMEIKSINTGRVGLRSLLFTVSKHTRLYFYYRRQKHLLGLFDNWLRLISELDVEHFIVNCGSNPYQVFDAKVATELSEARKKIF